MRSNYKKLGPYIQEVNIRNKDLKVELLLGVSIQKVLMPSIANTVGTKMHTYKVIKKNQFAYGPVTSRNGDKISIALLEDHDEAIVSQAYTVFEVKNKNELDPEYLMMWFRRPEYDRYARYHSHGSARETFDWEDFCETELPIPSIEKQREIVAEYNTVVNRIKLNEEINEKLEETAQAIYKHWFVDFEFPIDAELAAKMGDLKLEGKPYKSSGGKLVYNEELDKEIPEGWEVRKIENIIDVKDGTHDSPKPNVEGYPLITSRHIEPYTLNKNEAYLISSEDYNMINKRSEVEQFDILFSMIGTVGLIHFVLDYQINYAIKNVGLFKSSGSKDFAKYILLYLKSKYTSHYIESSLAGSTQSYVTLTTLRSIPLILPFKPVLLKFNNIADALIRFIYEKESENKNLICLKELILSKMTKATEFTEI